MYFQGKIGRFKVTSDNRNLTGAVYVKAENTRNRVHVVGLITDSIFHELAHEYNGFALSFKVLDLFSTGNLTFLNNTFLNNENAISVYGGFKAFLTKVKINSIYGYAIMGSGPPKVMASVEGVKVILDQCILANNRVGIRMATITCQGVMCSPSSQELVVKNSLLLGGNETRGKGDAIRFRVREEGSLPRPAFIEATVLLENVTFQGLHDCALYAGVQKNV